MAAVRLPSLPGPSYVVAAVTGARDGVADALALVPRAAAVLGLTALLLPDMQVRGVLPALVGALVVTAVGFAASRWIGADGRIAVGPVSGLDEDRAAGPRQALGGRQELRTVGQPTQNDAPGVGRVAGN